MDKFIIKYKITNNKSGIHEFVNFEIAKKIYLELQENLTIKAAKLYEIKNNKKILIEKFTKKEIYPLNY